MTRRESILLSASALAGHKLLTAADVPSIESEIVRLKLKHTWTTVMSSSEYRDTLHLRYVRDGITGHGEGAPIVRYNESAESAQKVVESLRPSLLKSDPAAFSKIMADVFHRVEG